MFCLFAFSRSNIISLQKGDKVKWKRTRWQNRSENDFSMIKKTLLPRTQNSIMSIENGKYFRYSDDSGRVYRREYMSCNWCLSIQIVVIFFHTNFQCFDGNRMRWRMPFHWTEISWTLYMYNNQMQLICSPVDVLCAALVVAVAVCTGVYTTEFQKFHSISWSHRFDLRLSSCDVGWCSRFKYPVFAAQCCWRLTKLRNCWIHFIFPCDEQQMRARPERNQNAKRKNEEELFARCK